MLKSNKGGEVAAGQAITLPEAFRGQKHRPALVLLLSTGDQDSGQHVLYCTCTCVCLLLVSQA
jgi:hypothetical protein